MVKFEINEYGSFTKIGTMKSPAVPPIGTYLIIQNTSYIIIDYVIVDVDFDLWKMVVRKVNKNDKSCYVVKGK